MSRKEKRAKAEAKRVKFANLHGLFAAMTHQDNSESIQRELAKLTPNDLAMFKQGVNKYKFERMMS